MIFKAFFRTDSDSMSMETIFFFFFLTMMMMMTLKMSRTNFSFLCLYIFHTFPFNFPLFSYFPFYLCIFLGVMAVYFYCFIWFGKRIFSCSFFEITKCWYNMRDALTWWLGCLIIQIILFMAMKLHSQHLQK